MIEKITLRIEIFHRQGGLLEPILTEVLFKELTIMSVYPEKFLNLKYFPFKFSNI